MHNECVLVVYHQQTVPAVLYSAGLGLPCVYTILCSVMPLVVLGRHGSASLCRVEWENKMAATYNVLAFKR